MRRLAPLLLSLLVVAGLFISPLFASQPVRSVELGIAEHSPLGVAGGTVVPASCPSYDHWNAPNACAACPLGYDYDGGDTCVATGWCGGYYYWEPISQTCQDCNVDKDPPQTQVIACPPGQTGQINQYRTGSCPVSGQAPVWSEWITSSNTCVSPVVPPTVTITPPGGSPGSTANVIVGQSATITWSCPSPNTSSSGVNFSTGGEVSGSTGVVVTTDKTYTVICDQTTGQASVTAVAINANMSLAAAPSRVRVNGTSVLTWSASGVTSCALSGPGTSDSATAVSGSIAPRNKTTAAITGQSTYTLTCQTAATPISTSVNVMLIPIQIEI